MEEKNTAEEQAKSQLESIIEIIGRYNKAKTDKTKEKIEEEIREDVLSAEMVRSYNILLCWGGPAVRIIGKLSENNEPETAEIQYQDWFTLWETLKISEEEKNALLEFAQKFYFGE